MPGTRSVYAERAAGGYFLDFDLQRDQLARYGLTIAATPRRSIMSAIGGETVTTTVEGRERYAVNVRYARELRDDLPALRRVLVPTPSRRAGPAGGTRRHPARPRARHDPRRERHARRLRLRGHRRERHRRLRRPPRPSWTREVHPPAGYSLQWSGQYESMLRVRERLKIVVPITLFLIFMLLYMNTKSRRQGAASSCSPCRSRPSAPSGCCTCWATTSRSRSGWA